MSILKSLMVAVTATAAAGLLRWLLEPTLGDSIPYATFFIAVVVAVRYGGLGSALVAMLLGLAWATLAWFPEGLLARPTISAAGVYLFSSLAIITLGLRMHRAEAQAEEQARELRESVQVLRASQGRLQLATQMSDIGVFEWDVIGDQFTGENPEAYRIFGRSDGMPKLSLDEFIERHLHPEDIQRVQGLLKMAMRPGERFSTVFRSSARSAAIEGNPLPADAGGATNRDAIGWRWLEVAGRFFFDDAGTPTHLVGVIADITERKELEDNLRKMAADLSEADHRKDEFLATLAHELRNPLAPIRNGIEVLKRSPANVGPTHGVVGVMERQMGHLVRLVDDLIDVSRITRNRLELRRERVDLAQVIQAAVEACRPLIESNGHQLTLSPLLAPITLDADPTRLVQVFSNLINNAAKYTDRGGRILVTAERRDDTACVNVIDNGTGIPASIRPRLFQMFTQLDRSQERSQGGLGIGLSMVKRLVELHGGTVEIASDGIGQGTRASVCLPALASSDRPAVIATEPVDAFVARRRILVVDDNTDAADSLANVLTLMGNEVAIGNDGVEATELAEVFRPDVVMLDLGMPRMNGFEACQRIRAQPDNANIVIIAVTGWGQDEDRRRSELAGFNMHLTKPVDPTALQALLASLPAPREWSGEPGEAPKAR